MNDRARLLDHPVIGRRLFHPRAATIAPTFVVGSGLDRLGCHVRQVHPDAGWVVHFHGNGEIAAECDRYNSDLFTDAGMNVCFVEYRGYGASGGAATLASMLDDGARVVEALGVAPSRVVAFGRSLGSLYAIELAHRLPDLAGLVLESGISDLNEHWSLGLQAPGVGCDAALITEAVAALFDHRVKLGRYKGPTLVLHAMGDSLVHPSHAQRMHDWAGGADRRLVLFPRGDHNSIFALNIAEYVSELHAFLRKTGLTVEKSRYQDS